MLEYTEEQLENLKYNNHGIYVRTMRKLGRDPYPKPTMKIIIETRKLLTKDEKDELNSAEACMLVACRPAVELLRKVVYKYPGINYIGTKKTVQEIEKQLYKLTLYRSSTSVVGLAIYWGNNITRKQSSIIMREFGGCSIMSLYNLEKLLNEIK